MSASDSGEDASQSKRHTSINESKWSCAVCTYQNWPAARRCAMCFQSRPNFAVNAYSDSDPSSQNFGSSSTGQNSNDEGKTGQGARVVESAGVALRIEDSVSVAQVPVHRAQGATEPPVAAVGGVSTIKWSCSRCTYLNWPKSTACVQCKAQKGSCDTTCSNTNVVKSDTSGDENDHADSGDAAERQASPPIAPGPSGCAAARQSDAAFAAPPSSAVARQLNKWSCAQCTYENWPKTKVCVMCRAPRHPTSGPDAHRAGPARCVAAGEPAVNTNNFSRGNSQSARSSPDQSIEIQDCGNRAEYAIDAHLRRLRHRPATQLDWLWLTAVRSLATNVTGDTGPVEAYLAAGGDPCRGLKNSEATLLEPLSTVNGVRLAAGSTLVHIALQAGRDDVLPILLHCEGADAAEADALLDGGSSVASSSAVANTFSDGSLSRPVKRVPCHLSPDTAACIRARVHAVLRQRKAAALCAWHMGEMSTFALPAAVMDLPPEVQARLFDELLDVQVQTELEQECCAINWSVELVDELGSRLYALWNRTAGDCLLDSVMQATWGVFDTDNQLRHALAQSIVDASHAFYPRWMENERALAAELDFDLEDWQLARDWNTLQRLARRQGTALEQLHIWVLAHVIRRPIIVYSVRYVKSMAGEQLDLARFEGVYLPSLWDVAFCNRTPVCLGYTRVWDCPQGPLHRARAHGAEQTAAGEQY